MMVGSRKGVRLAVPPYAIMFAISVNKAMADMLYAVSLNMYTG